MTVERLPEPARELVERYLERLRLPAGELMITVDRREFERWLGRRVSASLGGAYIYLPRRNRHAVLINLPRIDLAQPKALEVVVAEELVHMRDRLDGDRRRHAKHGYDRIAYRVAALTGASLEEIRSALLPVERRPYRYIYACPGCGARVKRRRRGRWSCGRCAPRFDARFELRMVEELGKTGYTGSRDPRRRALTHDRRGQRVRFIRLFLRGLKDAYDQFVLVMVVSALWWVCAVLIVPGPPATVALFRIMDPRNQVRSVEVRDFFRVLREEFRTAWTIAGLTLPLILVLLWNAAFFRQTDSFFALMVPLWMVMALLTGITLVYALATVATMESKTRNAFRGAFFQLVMRPFSSALMFVLLLVIMALFTVLVLPLIFFGPGVFAAVVNRFLLTNYNVEIIDPNAPTSERRTEVSRGLNPDPGMLQRLRGGQRRQEGRR